MRHHMIADESPLIDRAVNLLTIDREPEDNHRWNGRPDDFKQKHFLQWVLHLISSPFFLAEGK